MIAGAREPLGATPGGSPLQLVIGLRVQGCIALVLQGGGALGAYQAGVYEALAEAELHPDWIAGISIGAIMAR